MAQNGLARAILPTQPILDGGTIFSIANCKKAGVSIVGAYEAEVVAQAIFSGVKTSASILGIPGVSVSLEARNLEPMNHNKRKCNIATHLAPKP